MSEKLSGFSVEHGDFQLVIDDHPIRVNVHGDFLLHADACQAISSPAISGGNGFRHGSSGNFLPLAGQFIGM